MIETVDLDQEEDVGIIVLIEEGTEEVEDRVVAIDITVKTSMFVVAVIAEEEAEMGIIRIEMIERNTQLIEMDITKKQIWTEKIIITEKETYRLALSAMMTIKYAIANTK